MNLSEPGIVFTENDRDEFVRLSSDLCCVVGRRGHLRRLSPKCSEVLKWTTQDVKDLPIQHLMHPDDQPAMESALCALGEGDSTVCVTNRCRCGDGSYRWLRWTARSGPGDEQVLVAHDLTEERRLEREILELADQERDSLERELHDGLCQTLAGISALSTALSKDVTRMSVAKASAAAEEIASLLKAAIIEARDLSRGLGPTAVETSGLDGALEALARSVQRLFRVSCTLTCKRPFAVGPAETEVHLYRIAQQAVHNAIIHGFARQIDISLSSTNGEGRLRIVDEGVGLPSGKKLSNGIGLRTMAYRARLIGAELTVRQHASGGTVVTCSF